VTYCRLCSYPHYALGLCEAHYVRRRRGLPLVEDLVRRRTPDEAEARLARRNRKATERKNARQRQRRAA